MSPQSRAATENTTFANSSRDGDGSWSGNVCSGASSVADLAHAANMEYALHKIESESSANTPANPLAHQATMGAPTSRKRSSARISTSPASKNQPFLSSYGSAFLSGIFADIAQASDENQDDSVPIANAMADPAAEPCLKKVRATASTSFSRQQKSFTALAGLADGAVGGGVHSMSPLVSPRPNASTTTLKIQLPFNDQVRELQDMAFPALPQIPITVSSSSCSSSSQALANTTCDVATGGGDTGEKDSGPSYGWFVSTEDETADQNEGSAPSMFLPDTKPDLAFKALTAPDV